MIEHHALRTNTHAAQLSEDIISDSDAIQLSVCPYELTLCHKLSRLYHIAHVAHAPPPKGYVHSLADGVIKIITMLHHNLTL